MSDKAGSEKVYLELNAIANSIGMILFSIPIECPFLTGRYRGPQLTGVLDAEIGNATRECSVFGSLIHVQESSARPYPVIIRILVPANKLGRNHSGCFVAYRDTTILSRLRLIIEAYLPVRDGGYRMKRKKSQK